MNLVWAPQALRDINDLYAYISQDDPAAAKKVAARIVSLVETRLPSMPHLGKPGRVDGTRELAVTGTPFIVPYRVEDQEIRVLRVYHAARRWPSTL